MILSLGNQARVFLSVVAAGACAALFYDAIRIVRTIVKHGKILIQAEDGIYWLAVVFMVFFFMLHENYGEIRFFVICGFFIGMMLYFLILSKTVMNISDKIIAIGKYIIMLIIRIFMTPFFLVWLLIRKPVRNTGKFFNTKAKKLLHLSKVCVKIKAKTFTGQFKFFRTKKR